MNFQDYPSPTGAKTLKILDILSKSSSGLTATEVSQISEINNNLSFRILKTMEQMGFAARQPENKKFQLSQKVLDLYQPQIQEKRLMEVVQKGLTHLKTVTGETSQIIAEHNGKAVVLDQLIGTHPVLVHGKVGMHIPMYSCAPGKILLAHYPKEVFQDWLKGRKLKKFTPTTINTHDDLKKELIQINEQGYALDHGEGIEGIRCVAAPIFNPAKKVIASITLMGPSFRINESTMSELIKEVVFSAKLISDELKH